MKTNAALWARLTAYELDDERSRFPFSARLARENGWTKLYAKRAIEEYKRFVYLAMVSPGDVTPSDIVDQVWHLHLTYTRSYWNEMCKDLLGTPLHHGPTQGGSAEGLRYSVQYEKTIALYEAEFGHLPPADLWPDEDHRFAGAVHQSWVDKRRFWLIPKPNHAAARVAAVFVSVATMSISGWAVAANGTSSKGGSISWPFLLMGAAVLVVLLGNLARSQAARGKDKKKNDDSGSYVGGCGSGSGGKSNSRDNDGDGGSGGDGSGCGGGGCGGCGG
jgi:hypothetical protein